MPKPPKRPRDPAQLAKLVVDIATGEVADSPARSTDDSVDASAAIGSPGGRKGGAARAVALSPERRQEIARLAASSRWQKDKEDGRK
jgi:hypothetical protein